MSKKSRTESAENKPYPTQQASSSSAQEPEAVYEIQSDLLEDESDRPYYTVDEFFSILKEEINERFGYEMIKDN
jgi:hypothetical protein